MSSIKSLIDGASLKAIAEQEPIIETMFRDERILEMLGNQEMETILRNREDALVQCGGKFRSLMGIKTSGSAHLIFDPELIGKVCQGSPQAVFHFHGPYLSALSSDDRVTHETFFNTGFQLGCAIGIDGFSCQTGTRSFRIPWSKKFIEKLRDNHIPSFEEVETISCFGGKGKAKECTLHFLNGDPPYTNMFQEVVSEHQFGAIPYVWYDKNSIMPPMNLPFRKGEEMKQVCVTPLTTKKNRILTCFNQVED